jgi:ATP-dependent exoDNAse (exonuclease V) beta subunit
MISKEKILRIIREETLSREAKRRIKISTIDKMLNQILSNHKFDENKSVEFNTMLVLGLVMFAVIDEFDREEFPEFQEELRNFILDRYKVSVGKFFVDKGLGL